MALAHRQDRNPVPATDWPALMQALGPRFAGRAAAHDADDSFVADNFTELKERDAFAAGVPAELGGGGASYPELCEMLRVLARSCGATALALSMHTHQIVTAAWRWRHGAAAVEPLLRRVAAERLVLVTSGASDWVDASGTAEPVDGGWRIKARKIFASGSPSGDLMMTQAVYHDPEHGPTVLHFAIPLRGAGVRIEETWRTLGMRATGSHDVLIDDVLIPEAGVMLRRPSGKWIPLFHLYACTIPQPLVYAVYVGVAEAARETAIAMARRRPQDAGLVFLVGELENELALARMAHRDMVEAAATCEEPGPETSNRIFIGRTLVGRAVTRVAEQTMELAGGAAFYRAAGLERLFRDLQGARFHRPQERMQLALTGRLALGLPFE